MDYSSSRSEWNARVQLVALLQKAAAANDEVILHLHLPLLAATAAAI